MRRAAPSSTSCPRPPAFASGDWTCAPVPALLLDRRVEITGPVDRKMIINALNSGANVFMADFEDSTTPTWTNLVDGQHNLCDAVRRTITFEQRPEEVRAQREDGDPLRAPARLAPPREARRRRRRARRRARSSTSASTSSTTRRSSSRAAPGPFFYLPKLESHLEARLWNDVFLRAQETLGVPRGTIKATVLIETLPAAFEMDEILYELREHSAGLNCGRWDYIFSFIKKRANDPDAHPPRPRPGHDGQGVPARLRRSSSSRRATAAACTRWAAWPRRSRSRTTPPKNDAALAKVRADKLREVKSGHDGTWVAHPGLVPIAREIFDAHMKGPNQLDVKREDVHVGRGGPARGAAGHAHRERAPPQHARRRPVPRGVAARPRLRAALQPDGGRRDRRDLARAGLAVDPPPGDARRRHGGLARPLPQGRRRGDGSRPRRDRRRALHPRQVHGGARRSSSGSRSRLASRSS